MWADACESTQFPDEKELVLSDVQRLWQDLKYDAAEKTCWGMFTKREKNLASLWVMCPPPDWPDAYIVDVRGHKIVSLCPFCPDFPVADIQHINTDGHKRRLRSKCKIRLYYPPDLDEHGVPETLELGTSPFPTLDRWRTHFEQVATQAIHCDAGAVREWLLYAYQQCKDPSDITGNYCFKRRFSKQYRQPGPPWNMRTSDAPGFWYHGLHVPECREGIPLSGTIGAGCAPPHTWPVTTGSIMSSDIEVSVSSGELRTGIYKLPRVQDPEYQIEVQNSSFAWAGGFVHGFAPPPGLGQRKSLVLMCTATIGQTPWNGTRVDEPWAAGHSIGWAYILKTQCDKTADGLRGNGGISEHAALMFTPAIGHLLSLTLGLRAAVNHIKNGDANDVWHLELYGTCLEALQYVAGTTRPPQEIRRLANHAKEAWKELVSFCRNKHWSVVYVPPDKNDFMSHEKVTAIGQLLDAQDPRRNDNWDSFVGGIHVLPEALLDALCEASEAMERHIRK